MIWSCDKQLFGNDGKLRLWLEEHQVAHVLGVSGNHFVVIGWEQQKVSTVAAQFPPDAWQQWSAGHGSRGPRMAVRCTRRTVISPNFPAFAGQIHCNQARKGYQFSCSKQE